MTHTSDAVPLAELARLAATLEKWAGFVVLLLEWAPSLTPRSLGMKVLPVTKKAGSLPYDVTGTVVVDCCEPGQIKRTNAGAKGYRANGSGRDCGSLLFRNMAEPLGVEWKQRVKSCPGFSNVKVPERCEYTYTYMYM